MIESRNKAYRSFRYTAVQSIRYVFKLTYSLIFELNLLLMPANSVKGRKNNFSHRLNDPLTSEVFVDVWLSLDKSISNFCMVTRK